ncbi:MAG: glycine cleavage system aminomethyltransferase GcvT [Defluviitaleaceae bacterium]|nr:glycine cleavage system aminomethyltransferase GcvT [Defluviitaleaceae bacterium]
MESKTPLYARHAALGGKIVPYAGWLLPVQYRAGVIAEHMAVRKAAGLFDVSHMGEVTLTGPQALENAQRLFTNDFAKMKDGQIKYTVMCGENGGILDDMLVYRLGAERFLIVVNAANRETDAEWMRAHISGNVALDDVSDETAQISIQGPSAAAILSKLADGLPQERYTFAENLSIAGAACLVSRTGYTGEDGFELYCSPESAGGLWDALLLAGKDEGLIPCGLGCGDTLRLEAAMPLYGHEMSRDITPLETGLRFAVKFNKGDFIGKTAMLAKGEPARKRIGLKVTGAGIARENSPVLIDGKVIGHTTSGTFCPFLGYAAAMALVDADTPPVAEAEIDVRGRLIKAEIAPLPFYSRS